MHDALYCGKCGGVCGQREYVARYDEKTGQAHKHIRYECANYRWYDNGHTVRRQCSGGTAQEQMACYFLMINR